MKFSLDYSKNSFDVVDLVILLHKSILNAEEWNLIMADDALPSSAKKRHFDQKFHSK